MLYGFDATVPDIGMKRLLITQTGFGGICVQVPSDVAKYQFVFLDFIGYGDFSLRQQYLTSVCSRELFAFLDFHWPSRLRYYV